jgi:Protein of unknown function (DUF2971)
MAPPAPTQMTHETTTVPPWKYLKLQRTITNFARPLSRQSKEGEIVWHYTNAAGLIGIIESGYVRGTNYAFMNDALEFEYGCAVADEVLVQLQARPDGSGFFSRIAEELKQFTKESEIYLACFSGFGDDLSQWRGYSSGPDRFSLGIAIAELNQGEPDTLRQRAVEYERSIQQQDIRNFLLRAWETVKTEGGVELESAAATMLVPFLFDILCFYKDERFAAEKEWRVAKRLNTSELTEVGFSDSPAGLRAYLPLCGSSERASLPLKTVNFLSAHPARADKFVTMLLRKAGYLNVTVMKSGIPFVL